MAAVRGAQEEKFTSSYGTGRAIPPCTGKRLCNPIADRGSGSPPRWTAELTGSRAAPSPARARWVDYPGWPEAQEDFLGVSGFALFALHRVGAWWLGSLDRDWLRELPAQAPAALRGECPRRRCRSANRSFPDEPRYYELPWTYSRPRRSTGAPGSSEKSARCSGSERALAPGLRSRITGSEKGAAIVAEALLALRSEAKHE